MFDPTVFDNLKVVIEGAVYDLDLEGLIYVSNRNDKVDLANMSRTYQVSFHDKSRSEAFPLAYVKLEATVENLAGELLQKETFSHGCRLEIGFEIEIAHIEEQCRMLQETVEKIWGPERNIQQTISFEYGKSKQLYKSVITILFDRPIFEENVDDLLEMIPYIVKTLDEFVNISRK